MTHVLLFQCDVIFFLQMLALFAEESIFWLHYSFHLHLVKSVLFEASQAEGVEQ